MCVKNSIGRKTSTRSHFSTRQKSLVALAAAANLGLMVGSHSARADLLQWVGANSSTWDGTTNNWNDVNNPSIDPTTYVDGDPVQFTTGGNGTVVVGNVTGSTPNGVSPASVEFTAGSQSFTFTDASGDTNGIQGAATVTVDAGYTGEVSFNGLNTYSGTTTINGGTLSADANLTSPLGTSTVVLNNGTLINHGSSDVFTNSVVLNSGTTSGLSATANWVFTGNLSTSAGASPATTTLSISGSANDTYSYEPATNTNPLGNFSGTIAWGATTTDMRFEAIAAADALGSSNAVFNMGSGATAEIQMINNTGVLLLGGLLGTATGQTINGPTHSGLNTNALYVIGGAGINSSFAGTIVSSSTGRSTVEVAGGGTLTLSNGGSSYGTKTGSAPNYQGAGTTILGNGQEPMAGSLTAFLTGNASNGGGALYVTNTSGSATGTTPLLIEGASSATNNGNGISGGLLGGTGIVGGEVSTIVNGVNEATNSATPLLNYNAGSIIAPGALATNANNFGTLSLTGGLQIGDDANLDYALNTTPVGLNDLLNVSATTSGNGQVANALTLPGAADANGNWVRVNFAFPNGNPALNLPYDLISYTGTDLYTSSGSSASLANWAATGVPAGDTVTFADTSTEITATFAAVPEPATFSLLGLGAIGLLRRRRARA